MKKNNKRGKCGLKKTFIYCNQKRMHNSRSWRFILFCNSEHEECLKSKCRKKKNKEIKIKKKKNEQKIMVRLEKQSAFERSFPQKLEY